MTQSFSSSGTGPQKRIFAEVLADLIREDEDLRILAIKEDEKKRWAESEYKRMQIQAENDRMIQDAKKYRAARELKRTKMREAEIERMVQEGEKKYPAESELNRTKTHDAEIDLLIQETEHYRAKEELKHANFEATYKGLFMNDKHEAGDKDKIEANDKDDKHEADDKDDKHEAGDDKHEPGDNDKIEANDKGDKHEAGDKDKIEANYKALFKDDKHEAGDKDKIEALFTDDKHEAGEKEKLKDKFEANDKYKFEDSQEEKLKDKYGGGDKDKMHGFQDLQGVQDEPLFDFYGRPTREPDAPAPIGPIKIYKHPRYGKVRGQRYAHGVRILDLLDEPFEESQPLLPLRVAVQPKGYFVRLARGLVGGGATVLD